MAELPSGTVTFLLTDVEGSTALWELAPEPMRAALARHDAIFENAVRAYRGLHIRPRGEGDSRFAVFAAAPEAVAATLAIQRAFAAEPWPTPRPIKVRIGVHTGEAELRDGDYYGSAVNRCARLRGIAHGGQVLLSATTASLACERLPSGASLRDLGEHRLKDLVLPERVFQVTAPDLPSDFPPLGSLNARLHNPRSALVLPIQPTPLVGRERQVAEVRTLLDGGARLVTLTGPGGVGKTRLGLQAAAELVDRFDDGVVFIPLASIGDPDLVISTIAQTLGLRETGGLPLQDTVKGYLADRHLLLVLDNFEQVLHAAPLVADLLAACPKLAALVTSRAVLHLRGERELAVPPLACPDPDDGHAVENLSRYAAVALFVQRATAETRTFSVTDENASAVAEICRRVDGLPLGIELAAVRVRLLTPQALLARMERRLPILTGGPRDLPERQRTLGDTIAWSYDLLDEGEQRLFRRLSVFEGGCTLEAAETVCSADEDLGIPILDSLAALITQSLVLRLEGPDGEPRFTMLETIREYGLRRLDESGEAVDIRRRHAEYFLRLSMPSDAARRGPEQATWLRRLEREHDNLRVMLAWSVEAQDEPDVLARIARAFWRFWWMRGHLSEARRWLERALARATEPPARIEVLQIAGRLAFFQDEYPRANALLTEAIAMSRASGDQGSLASGLETLSYVTRLAGDYERAAELCDESLALTRQLGNGVRIGYSLHACALVAYGQGDVGRAAEAWEEALRLHRESGYITFVPHLLHGLARLAMERDELERATMLCEEAAELFEQQDDNYGLLLCLIGLMRIAQRRGDTGQVVRLASEVLALGRTWGSRTAIRNVLESLASVARARGDPNRAARLFGAAETLRETLGQAPSTEHSRDEAEIATVHSELGEETFAAAWQDGRAMTLEQAIAYAMEGLGSPA
jgi:predicted ATPase/class 3 adenylate cyclase